MSKTSTVEEARKYLERPSDFGYHGDLPLFETWTLGPVICHRDSSVREASNAAVIKRIFADALGEESDECNPPTGKWAIVSCNHWAVGWVNHLAFEVITPEGEVSEAVEEWEEIEGALSDYPLLDDEDYYKRVEEALEESIKGITPRCDGFEIKLPEGWYDAVRYAVGSDYHEDSDGVYISESKFMEIVCVFGWVRCESCGSAVDSTEDHRCPTAIEEMAENEEER